MSCDVSSSWLQFLLLFTAMTAFPRTLKQHCHIRSKLAKRSLWLAAIGKSQPTVLNQPMEQALFGMGCFWSPQNVFTRLDGVVQVTSGFAGVDDNSRKASYISVCGGDGRTEAILIDFFPTVVSYPELLQTFWRHHDATKIQKPQYHSVIFPFNDQQRALAELDVQLANEAYQRQGMRTVQTLVASSFPHFTPAESIHQNFWAKLQLKLLFLSAGIFLSTAAIPSIMVDRMAINVTFKLVLVWVLWEVSVVFF